MKRPNIPGRIYVSGRDTRVTGLGLFVRAWVCFVCVCVCVCGGGGGEGKMYRRVIPSYFVGFSSDTVCLPPV